MLTLRRSIAISSATYIAMFGNNANASKLYVNAESTNTYTPCFTGSDLSNSNSSAVNFLNGITAVPNTPFLAANGGVLEDTNAYNVDYMDPGEAPNSPSGADDYLYADAPDVAISYFQGHGIGVVQGGSSCGGSAANCTSPPSGATNGWGGAVISNSGTCVATPAIGTGGLCDWATFRALVTCGRGDQASSGVPNHLAAFSTGAMVLGNNPTSGNWRGAGTNGGSSLTIFHISHGMDTFFPNLEWSPLYGGLTIFGSIQVGPNGDTNDSATGNVPLTVES
jgi:hypothetical protein